MTFHTVLTFLDVIRLLKVFWACAPCVTTWSRTIIITSVSLFVVDDPRESVGPYGERLCLSVMSLNVTAFMLIARFLVLFFRRWSQHDRHHWRWDSSMWGRKPRSDYYKKRWWWWWWWFCFLLQFCWPSVRLRRAQVSRAQISYSCYSYMFLMFSLFSCVDDSFREARWSRPALLWLVDSSKCLKHADLRDSLYERNSVRDQIWCLLFDRKYRL